MKKTVVKKQYSKKTLQKLKNNIKIEDVIREDFGLHKAGKNYFTICPFCGAKKALCVSIQNQFAYCFSCQESFDVFGYYQKVKGLSFCQSVIEVKKHINTNNIIELKKLSKASNYFADLKQGKNPISKEPIKSSFLKTETIIETLNKLDWVILLLISYYFDFSQQKYLLSEEIDDCKQNVQNILEVGFSEESVDSQIRLTNLFKYILKLLELIKNNNGNLSGIVYGLK